MCAQASQIGIYGKTQILHGEGNGEEEEDHQERRYCDAEERRSKDDCTEYQRIETGPDGYCPMGTMYLV